jgi:hypothetical protein
MHSPPVLLLVNNTVKEVFNCSALLKATHSTQMKLFQDANTKNPSTADCSWLLASNLDQLLIPSDLTEVHYQVYGREHHT